MTRPQVGDFKVAIGEDGKVTFKEYEKYFGNDKAKFNEADLDKDGQLTHDEYHNLLGHGSS